MWAAIITAISSLILSAFKFVFGEKQQAAGVAQGKAEANASTAAQSASTEAAIAQAEADAPKTKEAVEERLRDGTF